MNGKEKSDHRLELENLELRARLKEMQETLDAIHYGEVDALVVHGKQGIQVYTLQGSDYVYRMMMETIQEGAASLQDDGIILYSNSYLAEMLNVPLQNVIGSSFYNYLPLFAHESFQILVQKGLENSGKAEFDLLRSDETTVPALITASKAEVDGRLGICLIITDLTEQKQAMAREMELQRRLMEQREQERVRIARNLHDGPLQNLISLSFTVQAMTVAAQNSEESKDLLTIRQDLLKLAGELRNVCNELRPPNIIRFGLAKAIHYHIEELQGKYPKISIHLDAQEGIPTISSDISMALFSVYQECMNNVLRHASATHINIQIGMNDGWIVLEVADDGVGFTVPDNWLELARQDHLGLIGMKERMQAAGGSIFIKSAPGDGTIVRVKIPCQSCEM